MAITLKNINQLAASDLSDVWWGLPVANVIYGTNLSLANGEDSGMGRFLAASDITTTVPSLPNINLDSDQGIDGSVKGRPDAPVTAVITGGVIDQIFAAAASNRVIYAVGPHDLLGASLLCLAFNPTMYVINRPGRVRETGANYGAQIYEVTELWSCLADVKQINQMARGAQGTQLAELVANHVGKAPWGETITEANWGVTRLFGAEPYQSEYPVTYHTFIGDGTATTVTLDVTPASADGDALQIWKDGVALSYTSDFTVVTATKIVTFAVAPASGTINVMKIQYSPSC